MYLLFARRLLFNVLLSIVLFYEINTTLSLKLKCEVANSKDVLFLPARLCVLACFYQKARPEAVSSGTKYGGIRF